MQPTSSGDQHPAVFLVGTGVVGRAILRAHTRAGVSVCVCDQDAQSLREAVAQLQLDTSWRISEIFHSGDRLPTIGLVSSFLSADSGTRPIVIESIAERLDVKRDFFCEAETLFGDDTILCSNTSTLRIDAIAEPLRYPERFCGLHFFMPVDLRPAVEVIRGRATAEATIGRCCDHARRIGKDPLVVADSPGFIVNRLLSPYLNEALLLLGRGVSADAIERAARRYGMPLSPLELIDWIGTRTMFDAGRVYWQSFPTRVDPSPILTSLIKRKRFGRAHGGGLYDYHGQQRSAQLSPTAVELCEKYHRPFESLSEDDVLLLLAIPMWIEAAITLKERAVTSLDQFDLAMRGGLGYSPADSWLDFYDSLGSATIRDAIQRWSSVDKAIRAPEQLVEMLAATNPRDALRLFATT